MTRYPSVAGMFYPGNAAMLRADVERFSQNKGKKIGVKGLISPHAGYIYSGSCAGKGLGSVVIPDRVVILGVNHRGAGHPMAVDGNSRWNTPLGNIAVDDELRTRLTERSEVFKVDSMPAADEHSLEVQVPFIQVLNPEAAILPVTIGYTGRDALKQGGIELAEVISDSDGDILIIASTDMSHYISAEMARELDSHAIAKITRLDPDGFYDTVVSRRISMCGAAPVYVMMTAAKQLGATRGKVIEYTNSGYTSGDFDQVVGYLSAVVV